MVVAGEEVWSGVCAYLDPQLGEKFSGMCVNPICTDHLTMATSSLPPDSGEFVECSGECGVREK